MTLQELADQLEAHYDAHRDHTSTIHGCCDEMRIVLAEFRRDRRKATTDSQPTDMSAKIMYFNLTSEPVYRGGLHPRKRNTPDKKKEVK